MNGDLAFTAKDKTFTTYLYAHLGQALQFSSNTYAETTPASGWPAGMDRTLKNNVWVLPNCPCPDIKGLDNCPASGATTCTVDRSNTSGIDFKNLTNYSGVAGVIPNSWDTYPDNNGIQLGWNYKSTKAGGETNLLSVLTGIDLIVTGKLQNNL